MTKTIHKSDSRGYADHGWLKSYHSFSFAGYHNPQRVRFGFLRVLNDDIVKGGMGFGTHPHDNMEIVTIPLQGEVAHQDSTGTKEVITAGEVQIMSAGSGLTHSEFNNSEKDDVNLLQIWVFPEKRDIDPRYDQKKFDKKNRINKFQTVVSPDKSSGALWINQNAFFSLGDFEKKGSYRYDVKSPGNGIYMFVIKGTVETADEVLSDRDAIGIEDVNSVEFTVNSDSEILVIEVPMH